VTDLAKKLYDELESWLEAFIVLLPNLAIAIVVVSVAWYAAHWVRRGIYNFVYKVSKNAPVSGLLGTLSRVTVIGVAVFFALGLLGLDKTVTSLLAGVGVVGLALGFAFQDIAANFMSGFIMALRRPFDVGDLVDVAG